MADPFRAYRGLERFFLMSRIRESVSPQRTSEEDRVVATMWYSRDESGEIRERIEYSDGRIVKE